MAIKFKTKKKEESSNNRELLGKINSVLLSTEANELDFVDYGYNADSEKSVLDWLVYDKNVGIISEEDGHGVVNLKITYEGNTAAITVDSGNVNNIGNDFYIVVLKLLEIA